MVKVRLSKVGAKNNRIYRIVAIDQRRAREGKALEVIGYWHPKKDSLRIDKKKLDYWISRGAELSPAVEKIISK